MHNPPTTPTPVFFGTLGAALAPATPVPGPLARLRRRFDALIGDFADGRISRLDVKLSLADLIAHDDTGAAWTIGASTGHWYTRPADGGDWKLADPSQARFAGAPITDPTKLALAATWVNDTVHTLDGDDAVTDAGDMAGIGEMTDEDGTAEKTNGQSSNGVLWTNEVGSDDVASTGFPPPTLPPALPPTVFTPPPPVPPALIPSVLLTPAVDGLDPDRYGIGVEADGDGPVPFTADDVDSDTADDVADGADGF